MAQTIITQNRTIINFEKLLAVFVDPDYGNDNPGAKSQGMKQLMAGLGLILLAIILVPVLQTMMTSAV